MFTVGLGLFGAAVVVLVYAGGAPRVLEGFGFGAALLAMFMRVGGGIFTKAADVGADLVGKVEQGIPEDDPRNAATIADNVGDNVGDCAGMAADLFESYAVTLVAALILGTAAFGLQGLLFPLIVPAIGVLTAVIGVYITRTREGEGSLTTINRSFYISAAISAVLSAVAAFLYLPNSFAGPDQPERRRVVEAMADPTRRCSRSSRCSSGSCWRRHPVADRLLHRHRGQARPGRRPVLADRRGHVILSGISVGFESAVYTALVISAAVFGAFTLATGSITVALFAVALAGTGLLTTVGRDRRDGHLRPGRRQRPGHRGDVGRRRGRRRRHPDRAGRGREHHQGHHQGHRHRHRGARRDGAVRLLPRRDHAGPRRRAGDRGRRRHGVRVRGVRAQHAGRRDHRCGRGVHVLRSGDQRRDPGRRRDRVRGAPPVPGEPGIMEGTVRPEYGAVVDICTRDSLRELATPGLLAICRPIAVGFGLGVGPLAGYLAGAIASGTLMAVFLANSGGAWDNAKKLVEDGNHGGKGSPRARGHGHRRHRRRPVQGHRRSRRSTRCSR
jgi:K(+)-stimulated pyrophosphate-energized sodium pump